MARAASPALSEAEVDITSSLFAGNAAEGFDSDSDGAGGPTEVPEVNDGLGDLGSQDEEDDAAFIAATQAAANRKSDNKSGGKKSGAFQSMGLNTHLLKAITRKGFSVPTPIQRKTIPLIIDGADVVGMARTGSGKTAAFVIPMIEKLKSHSVKVGARALVLSPSRELALQTLKVVKEMGKGTDFRTILLVGGDSLEEQFGSMASNPDIIIATPGRFEHLKIEMDLELSSIKYVVFDEADRLFEMGFAAQMTEILHSLPSSRQTLLFSATLPKSLVEFARAGLQDPRLVRLDAETKISPGLQSAFFTVKLGEKEAALLHLLRDVIKMPTGETIAAKAAKENINSKKRKRGVNTGANEMPTPYSTVLFAATKHHVEYLATMLQQYGFATAYVYGSLDQTARKVQTENFRSGLANVLVVTDVAARGLDIPILANVINYDFPSQPKIYVHRVGRTARAGREGWSYSLVTSKDMPYLLDLQLFLSQRLALGRTERSDDMYKTSIVVGTMTRDRLEEYVEEVNKMLGENDDLTMMRGVAAKGEQQYLRTRGSASAESVKRARQIAQAENSVDTHMLFENDEKENEEKQRQAMLARVSGFRPQETVFEVGRRGAATTEISELIKSRRNKLQAKTRSGTQGHIPEEELATPLDQEHRQPVHESDSDSDLELELSRPKGAQEDEASDSELALTFAASPGPNSAGRAKQSWQDSEHFMSYQPTTMNLAEDRGYGVNPNNFLESAKGATMDLTNDESKGFGEPNKARGLRWDKKSKKYVARANDDDGSKGPRMIRGESGLKIAASFRSGRFDAWRKANRVDRLPKIGEAERGNAHYASQGNKRFKHQMVKAPKDADKYRDDYYKQKKKVDEAKEKRIGRFAEGKGKNELKGAEDVRKLRKLQQNRKEKNARPSRKA